MVAEIANKIAASIEPRWAEETLVWLNMAIFKFSSQYITLWKGVLGMKCVGNRRKRDNDSGRSMVKSMSLSGSDRS